MIELQTEAGITLPFSSTFINSLEAWANTPEVVDLITETVGRVEYQRLKDMVATAQYTKKDVLLESLCSSLTTFLLNTENQAGDQSFFLIPLAAQLYVLGAISVGSKSN